MIFNDQAFGSLDSYDAYLKQIVTKLNLTIVSVKYIHY